MAVELVGVSLVLDSITLITVLRVAVDEAGAAAEDKIEAADDEAETTTPPLPAPIVKTAE